MNNSIALALVRHALTAAGSVAVSYGYIENADATAISGAVVALLGVALSVWNKRRKHD